jgi:plastocyanin
MERQKTVGLLIVVLIFTLAVLLDFNAVVPEVAPVVETPAVIEEPPEVLDLEPTQPEKRVVIQIVTNRLEPKVVTVEPGTMVVWINKDNRAHKLVSKDRSFISERMVPDEAFSTVFNEVGTYEYFDASFKFIQGKVIVSEEKDSFLAVTGGVVASLGISFRKFFGLD